ncbi:hypothetical protein ACKS0A_04071 [Histoplasma ohiense]
MTLNLAAGVPDSFSSSAAFRNKALTTLEPPFVNTVLPSRINPLPNAAILSLLSFARFMNNRPLVRRCDLIALKSPPGPSWPGLCNVVMRYRWKRSVPAERAIGFGIVRFKCVVCFSSRSRVSDIVEEGL